MDNVKFFDGDFRNNPKTNIFCAYCQRDLKPLQIKYLAWIGFENGPEIFNPKTLNEQDLNSDLSLCPIGNDCAKVVGKEWLITITQNVHKASEDKL